MFTGIIESQGIVREIEWQDSNIELTIESTLTKTLKIDQSLAHNGVCLTVTKIDLDKQTYSTVAIKETLEKSNIKDLNINDAVNLERCIKAEARMDGHFVQGHVDTVAQLIDVKNQNGSWDLSFKIKDQMPHLIVEKGSICINGISLTVVDEHPDHLSVSIIPYTYEHTNLSKLVINDWVNIEYDILGKYLQKHFKYLKN